MLDFFIDILGNTIGKMHFPFVDKKFDLNHYFKIEERLSELDAPFAIAIVTTYGHGTNLLIKGAQFFGLWKWSKLTHALTITRIKEHKFRAIEAVGGGLQEVTFLSSIGGRDEVLIRVPILPPEICKYFVEYIEGLAERDKTMNIEYNTAHDLDDPKRYDCSGTIYKAIEYAYKKVGSPCPVKPIIRGGKKTWSPIDAELSPFFKTVYDSRKGGF